MDVFFSVEKTVNWFESFGLYAVFFSILLNIVINMIAVVPPFFLAAANAAVFGIWPGFVISLIGETLGSICAYYFYRMILLRWDETTIAQRVPFLNPARWRWIHWLRSRSRREQNTVMFLARIMPFMPSPIVTFAAAAVGSRMFDFALITLIGKAPSIALETIIGYDIIFLGENWPRLLIVLAVVIIIYFVFRKKIQDFKRDA
jgi:uncharacterized membrane protein YdjX (TVP38/TMEM64 family)